MAFVWNERCCLLDYRFSPLEEMQREESEIAPGRRAVWEALGGGVETVCVTAVPKGVRHIFCNISRKEQLFRVL